MENKVNKVDISKKCVWKSLCVHIRIPSDSLSWGSLFGAAPWVAEKPARTEQPLSFFFDTSNDAEKYFNAGVTVSDTVWEQM